MGYTLRGAEIVFGGDVPIGSGLSSSAALEVATATAFLTLAKYMRSRRADRATVPARGE